VIVWIETTDKNLMLIFIVAYGRKQKGSNSKQHSHRLMSDVIVMVCESDDRSKIILILA
jgi:ribosomal protein S3AE